MFWLLVLSTAFLGVGAIIFILMRDSFRISRTRSGEDRTSAQKNGDAALINTMMQKKIPTPPPSPPAALFSGHNGKEAETFADTLAHMKEKPILPSTPKAYLRLEEHDNNLEHLLIRGTQRPWEAAKAPPREFSIEVTEKEQAPSEQKKELSDKTE